MKQPLHLDHLVLLESDINYTILHFEDGTSQIHSYTLKRYEEMLMSSIQFKRVHKSFIVNKNFINTSSDREVIMRNGKRIPLARRRKVIPLEKFSNIFIKTDDPLL
jgi:DNA-binding LytR/AlgR family response regulator